MAKKMFVVVSYDIVKDSRRNKVSKTLLDFGDRVQYSVFECKLDAAALKRLGDRLGRIIAKQEDSVRFYFLCENCVPKVKILGRGTVTRLDPFCIV
jgi:CRISPR-associated protein Cas2